MTSKPGGTEEKAMEIESEDQKADEEEDNDDPSAMSPQQRLFYFARRGDVSGIKEIARTVDVNGVDSEGTKHSPYIGRNTALHYAVESGSLECVQVLYNLEARLDVTNKLQSTPLHVAASLGYTDIVRFLIEMKADLDAKNVVQNTSLHCAVYAGHTETVRYMLSQLDEPRDALLEPNGVGMGAAKYTAHDDMKALLRTYFPKKKPDADNSPQEEEEEEEEQAQQGDTVEEEQTNDQDMDAEE